jgi:transposase
MDVHQASIAGADMAHAPHAAGVSLGAIGTRPCDLDQRIRQRPSKRQALGFVYAAGPCGSWLDRSLTQTGQVCWGVAPSLSPQTAGARVTTNRRDAIHVARLMRAGDLTPVDGPQVEADAIRDRSRAREEALPDLKTATHRLKALLLRHDRRATGRATWGPAQLRWLREVVCRTPAPQMVFQEAGPAVTEHPARRQRLARARQAHLPTWRLRPVVDALQALRGVQCRVAVTVMAERGDLARVDKPSQLLRDLGRTPSEDSTGDPRRQGAIPKTGNAPARRARIEGAWASRDPAQVSRPRHVRRDQRPQPIQASRWQAPGRLCPRARHLIARGTHATRGVVAIARDLRAFLWAMAPQVPVTPGHGRIDGLGITRATVWRIGRGAAPVWWNPRRRDEAARTPRASSEAGPRRTPVRWDSIHG